MDLKTFLRDLGSDEARAEFARKCGTTAGHMRNASYGQRPLAPGVCAAAERESGGVVRRWSTRPRDWHLIWPELIGAEGAPPIAHTEQQAA
jgi:DNA-binding transcriptional regulator YdaS (Cro superfamily)